MKLNEILREMNIQFMEREEGSKLKIYYCNIKVGKRKTDKIPILIAEDKRKNVLVIKSPIVTMDERRKKKILNIINEFNNEFIYGTVYLDSDYDLNYDLITPIKGEESEYDFNLVQRLIKDYYSNFLEILDRISEEDIVLKNE